MGLKAKNGKVEKSDVVRDPVPDPGYGWGERQPVEFPEKEDGDVLVREDGVDDLIMVMMPRQTWDAFQDLAKKYGGGAAEAMSTALKLLEKACETAEEENDDA